MSEYSRGLSIPTRRAVITPLGKINLFKLSDIDNSYRNVKRFDDYVNVAQYFQTLEHFHIDESKVVRVPNGIRLPYNSEWVREYNYIQFDNPMSYRDTGDPPPVITNTGTNGGAGDGETISYNYVYAFITDVRWINIQCCEVSYEIDIFTTYFWRLTPLTSFITRSHLFQKPDEEIGDNLEPETDISITNYLREYRDINTIEDIGLINNPPQQGYDLVVFSREWNDDSMHLTARGIVTALSTHYFTKVGEGMDYINAHSTEVKAAIMVPQFFRLKSVTPALIQSQPVAQVDEDCTKYLTNLDGYTPKNKKCFTYPFNNIEVITADGQKITLRYEYFKLGGLSSQQNQARYVLYGELSTEPKITLCPAYYLGNKNVIPADSHYSPDLTISISSFPIVSFAVDNFDNFILSGGFAQTTLGLISGIGTTMTGNLSGIITATGAGVQLLTEYGKPDRVNGIGSSIPPAALNINTFYICHKFPNSDEAKTLDDYFERKGYATNRLDTPDFNIRPYWCYYQIPEFNFVNETDVAIPMDAISKIKQSLANGVTFWDKDTHFGDYSKDNHTA